MAITINKAKNVEPQVAQPSAQDNPLAYLPESVADEVAQLPADVVAVFAAATELTPDLIESVADKLPETLLDSMITAMEEYLAQSVPANPQPVPAVQVTAQVPPTTPDANRKARRDALKSEIAANAKGGAVVAKQVEKPVLPPEVLASAPTATPQQAVVKAETPNIIFSMWDSLFPVGQQVTVINRGNGKFELHIGKVAPAVQAQPESAAKPVKEAKPKMSSIESYLIDDAYTAWLDAIKEAHPTLEDRIAYAESLGLKRGGEPGWKNVTNEGAPMPPSIENMYLISAIQKQQGIERYVEGARTSEERKAILNGTAPWPAAAKPRQ